MKNSICVVTGANSGIGFQTCLQLLEKGYTVYFSARNQEKVDETQQRLSSKNLKGESKGFICDFESFDSVRNLAKVIKDETDQIDVLINNAGCFFTSFGETKDGYERQLQINHLSPFLLSLELIDVLEKSSDPRLVFVASKAHYSGKINFEDLNHRENYSSMKVYGQSKLCNVLIANEFHRRHPKVASNSLHPGVVSTGIANKNANIFLSLGWTLMKPFMTSQSDGAKTTVFLATDLSIKGVGGKYYDKCKAVKPKSYALDEALAKRLWDESLEMIS